MGLKTNLTALLLLTTITRSERWSRQIANDERNTSSEGDWIPLSEPCPTCNPNDRSSNARVLNYHNNRQIQNSFTLTPNNLAYRQPIPFGQVQQFQKIIGINNPTQQKAKTIFKNTQAKQIPPSQSFFQFEVPAYHTNGRHKESFPGLHSGYQIHHTSSHHQQPLNTIINQKPSYQQEFYSPFQQQLQQQQQPQAQALMQSKPIQQNFIEDAKPSFKEKPVESKQLIPQHHSHYQSDISYPIQRPTSFQSPYQIPPSGQYQQHYPQDEEVQLLYVPYDTLYQQQRQPFTYKKFKLIQPPVNPVQINNFYTPEPIMTPAPLATTPIPSYENKLTSNAFLQTKIPSQKAKVVKQRSHQPPLAMFMIKPNHRSPDYTANDILTGLENSKSIAVLDAPIIGRTPDIFIGPAGMPAPNGYRKMELPYLSSLSNDIKNAPFFVAPLSYKPQPGYMKILLPEPHIGSVILNKPVREYKNNYNQIDGQLLTHTLHQPSRNTFITSYPDSTTRYISTSPRYTTETTKDTTAAIRNHQFVNPTKQTFYQETYFQNEQQSLRPIHSPQTKVEESQYQTENIRQGTVSNYGHFKPMPHHIVNEEYFNAREIPRPVAESIQSSTTESVNPQYTRETSTIEIEAVPLTSYHVTPKYNSHLTHETSADRPTLKSNKKIEEQRMKSYFRDQEAFKKIPKIHTSTSSSTRYESHTYTPLMFNYDKSPKTTLPSTKSYLFESSTQRTTPREKITFYTPNKIKEIEVTTDQPTLPLEQEFRKFRTDSSMKQYTTTFDRTTDSTRHHENLIHQNHQSSYVNEVVHNNVEHNQNSEQDIEYEPNPYQLPSELPPITPNLPGLVNALIEKERLKALNRTTTESIDTTNIIATTPQTEIKYSLTRNRRPNQPKTSTSSSVSYSVSVDTSTQRPVNRNRRPYRQRTQNNQTITTTSTARTTGIRNPNRVRYNLTPEERQQYRSRYRSNNNRKTPNNEEDNLDYQRDVLKQNYPVFKQTVQTSSSTTNLGQKSSEHSDSVQEASNTNKKSQNNFPGFLETMQIAKEYNKITQDNYGPGYFPNEEDSTASTDPNINKNDINTIFKTVPSTTVPSTNTTETLQDLKTAPPLIHRTAKLTQTTTTTTLSPETTTSTTKERYTIRSRARPDPAERRVVKIRGRIRKPHPASTTTTTTTTKPKNIYHRVQQFNQDFYQDEYKNDNQRYDDVRLDTEESQWSPSLINSDGFHPYNPQSIGESFRNLNEFNNEQEIVTLNPEQNNENETKSFSFSVTTQLKSSAATENKNLKENTKKELQSEKSSYKPNFSNMLNVLMDDMEKHIELNENNEKLENKDITTSSQKEQKKKRGFWKKVRVHLDETIEPAESQNIGHNIINSINDKEIQENDYGLKIKSAYNEVTNPTSTTTRNMNLIMAPRKNNENFSQTEIIEETTIIPEIQTDIPFSNQKNSINSETTILQDLDEFLTSRPITNDNDNLNTENLTTEINNNNNRRIDKDEDLEAQPSIFDEMKKQLSNLFSFNGDDTEDTIEPSLTARKQEYTSISRTQKPSLTEKDESKDNQQFQQDLMKSTFNISTATEISQETEICYRGRCVKSNNNPL